TGHMPSVPQQQWDRKAKNKPSHVALAVILASLEPATNDDSTCITDDPPILLQNHVFPQNAQLHQPTVVHCGQPFGDGLPLHVCVVPAVLDHLPQTWFSSISATSPSPPEPLPSFRPLPVGES